MWSSVFFWVENEYKFGRGVKSILYAVFYFRNKCHVSLCSIINKHIIRCAMSAQRLTFTFRYQTNLFSSIDCTLGGVNTYIFVRNIQRLGVTKFYNALGNILQIMLTSHKHELVTQWILQMFSTVITLNSGFFYAKILIFTNKSHGGQI